MVPIMMLTVVQKDEPILERIYINESTSLVRQEHFEWNSFRVKTQETIKLPEPTELICCFYGCLAKCKKIAS